MTRYIYYLLKDYQLVMEKGSISTEAKAYASISGKIYSCYLKIHFKKYLIETSEYSTINDYISIYVNGERIDQVTGVEVCVPLSWDIILKLVSGANEFKIYIERRYGEPTTTEKLYVIDMWLEIEGEDVTAQKYIELSDFMTQFVRIITSPQIVSMLVTLLVFILLFRLLFAMVG